MDVFGTVRSYIRNIQKYSKIDLSKCFGEVYSIHKANISYKDIYVREHKSDIVKKVYSSTESNGFSNSYTQTWHDDNYRNYTYTQTISLTSVLGTKFPQYTTGDFLVVLTKGGIATQNNSGYSSSGYVYVKSWEYNSTDATLTVNMNCYCASYAAFWAGLYDVYLIGG